MSISIARKLQAFHDLHFSSLRFEIVPAALTDEQVKRPAIWPPTPLKETETRASGGQEAFGIEQTEIDTLLTPEELEQNTCAISWMA